MTEKQALCAESPEDQKLRYARETWDRELRELRMCSGETSSRDLCVESALSSLANLVQVYAERIEQLEAALEEAQDEFEVARDELEGGISDLDSRMGRLEEAVDELTD